ncbi:MAG: FAD-binding oxidoreductase [Chloroflexota bacterium]
MTLAAEKLEATRKRLAEIVGPTGVLSGDQAAAFSAHGEEPAAVVLPTEESQAAEVAQLANAERIPVVVWGSGTKQDIEPVQPRDGIVLGTGQLNGTLELDAANLTVTVGAGKVVDDLQRELAEVKLFLPLDPVDSARATIGGTLATNSSGPNRLLYRTARDMVLGLRVVTATGDVIRVGGKTVKDVAGYDMKKLYIGSWGTLGAITAATFRLLPLPEASATIAMVFPQLSEACAATSALLGSFMRPSSAELVSHGAMPAPVEEAFQLKPGEYLLLVQVEGAVEAVERQKRDLAELAGKSGAREASPLEKGEEAELWRYRKEVFAAMPAERPAMLVKGSVLLKRVADFTGALMGLQGQGLQAAFAAHAGNGIVHGMVAAEPGGEEKLVSAAGRLQQVAAECGGFALLQKAPREVAGRVPLWPPRNDYGLMRAIKAQLDPNNLWNPARVPGGRV